MGAIPGAIPFMLGWVAATNSFGIEPGTSVYDPIFWQFPHFWALGWMLDDDYKKAGFNMLPTGKKDKKTAHKLYYYHLDDYNFNISLFWINRSFIFQVFMEQLLF